MLTQKPTIRHEHNNFI